MTQLRLNTHQKELFEKLTGLAVDVQVLQPRRSRLHLNLDPGTITFGQARKPYAVLRDPSFRPKANFAMKGLTDAVRSAARISVPAARPAAKALETFPMSPAGPGAGIRSKTATPAPICNLPASLRTPKRYPAGPAGSRPSS